MGLCTDSSPARLNKRIRCLCRPGLKDASKPRYRLFRRRLWSVRFFPLAVFPTISQTLTAEALAISMRGMQRRNVGCSAVAALSNQFGGKPVQFPGTLGLDIPSSSLYTAQIQEEQAYCGSQEPLCLFDPDRLGLFLAFCAKGWNRLNFLWIRMPRWPRWEIASYLYGACKQASEFLELPSRQCSAFRVLEYLLRFHSLPPKRIPVVLVPPVIMNIGHVKRKFHKVIDGMRCGPARRWVQAHF